MFKDHPDGVILFLKIQPGARKNEIIGEFDGRLKVKIQAPPVEGAANQVLSEFLAEVFGVSKSKVTLLSGEKSREKSVRLMGVSLGVAKTKLVSRGIALK